MRGPNQPRNKIKLGSSFKKMLGLQSMMCRESDVPPKDELMAGLARLGTSVDVIVAALEVEMTSDSRVDLPRDTSLSDFLRPDPCATFLAIATHSSTYLCRVLTGRGLTEEQLQSALAS